MNHRNRAIEEIIKLKVKYEGIKDTSLLRKLLKTKSNAEVYKILFNMRDKDELEIELNEYNTSLYADSFDQFDFM